MKITFSPYYGLINDFSDIFVHWNLISSFGYLIKDIVIWSLLYKLYVQSVEGKATSRFILLTPQFYYDLLKTFISKGFYSLQWRFIPPSPHAFISLPLQSGHGSSDLPKSTIRNEAQNKKNAATWAQRVKNVPELAEEARKHRDKNFNDQYKAYDPLLSDPDTSESYKKNETEDGLNTLKAEYLTDRTKMQQDGSSTAQDLQELKNKYDHERNSVIRCARDNNVSLDAAHTNDNVDGNSVTESVALAIDVIATQEKWKNIDENFDGDVLKYEKSVNALLRDNPSANRSALIDEGIQEEIDKKRAEQIMRERDQFLAHQQESEPLDTWDPDG